MAASVMESNGYSVSWKLFDISQWNFRITLSSIINKNYQVCEILQYKIWPPRSLLIQCNSVGARCISETNRHTSLKALTTVKY